MTGPDGWDPDQYNRFAAEREEPFWDLVQLIEPAESPRVADETADRRPGGRQPPQQGHADRARGAGQQQHRSEASAFSPPRRPLEF